MNETPRLRRQHRKNYNNPGHAHELTFSCYKGFQFLKAQRVCEWLVEAIQTARFKFSFDLWAYVFMPEHAHLLIHPLESKYDIADIRQAIKAPVGVKAIEYLKSYAPEWLQKITRMRGKNSERLFWQSGGGYDRNVTKPETLLNMIDYIHNNPCRRGLVEKPEEWLWSSACFYQSGKHGPMPIDPIPYEWLLEE